MRRETIAGSIFGCLLLLGTFAVQSLPAQEWAGDRFHIGVGGGYGVVSLGAAGERRGVRPQLHGRVGVRVSRSLVGVAEVAAFGLGDEEPRPSDVSVDDHQILVRHRTLEILRTTTLLFGAQFTVGGRGYIRPGVGLGRNSMAVYGPWPRMDQAETTSELGPAAGLALGHQLPVGRHLRVALEGVAHWSGGEDSSAPRWILGLQIVPMLRQ